ncbi:MAG: helix-turn-helix domain-containing protein [Enhydrobacter sp.]|nr:MAG: helix-turn-helix domain-containing protein [Enhydrobacter sp.]
MKLKPIRTEADYNAALRTIERYFDRPPRRGTPEADTFDILATLIEAYERRRWPVGLPRPIDAIRYRMEIAGYTQADLARLLGSRSRASEVLSGKRELTLPMIRRIAGAWSIPVDALVGPLDRQAA